MTIFKPLFFGTIALLLAAPSNAQEGTRDIAGEVDEILRWATPATPGCAVAASHEGERVVNGAYGSADLERGVPITSRTIFDVGSVQKQFTAASILLLVEEGRLSLSDDVREHVPELPDYGHTITLDHLLTHTSGIRDWPGMLPMAGDDCRTTAFATRGARRTSCRRTSSSFASCPMTSSRWYPWRARPRSIGAPDRGRRASTS